MEHTRSVELRNPSEKTGAASRKKEKDPLEVDEFEKHWRLQLGMRGKKWAGPVAIAELKRKGMYEFLLGKQVEVNAQILIERVVEELKAYQKEAQGVLAKEHFDDIDNFLKRELERIQAKEDRMRVSSLKALLARLRAKVEAARRSLDAIKRQKRDWQFGWQQFWPELPRKHLVERRIELDTRLQVELGKIFADYLRPEDRRERVTLETIARLVLLAYLVGGQAAEEKQTGLIRTHGTRRTLTVRNIRDNLRYSGLHKARNFRGKHRVKK